MEPITILIYVSIFFIVVVGTLLSLVLLRLFRILSKLDHITGYVDQVSSVLEMWTQMPIKILQGLFEKFIGR